MLLKSKNIKKVPMPWYGRVFKHFYSATILIFIVVYIWKVPQFHNQITTTQLPLLSGLKQGLGGAS